MATRARTKTAQLIAAAVEVVCPACGESQPNPDNGSFLWTMFMVEQAAAGAERACVSCDDPLRIVTRRTVPSNPPALPHDDSAGAD